MQEWVCILILGTFNKTIGESVCNGSNISVPGQPDDQCSYKGGLGGGIYSSVVLTNSIRKNNSIDHQGEVELGCDNQGELDAISGREANSTWWTSYDRLVMMLSSGDDVNSIGISSITKSIEIQTN